MEFNTEVQGWYKIEAIKADGTTRVLADWFPNLITNAGLNYMGNNSGYLTYCQVGSGTSTPQVTDTQLESRKATTSTQQSVTYFTQASSPYYFSASIRFRFDYGVAAGNLTEVGVGWGSTGSLFSRALILDSGGNPTTITVLSDEWLDVIYEFRMYPSMSDFTGTINLAGITYNWTARSAYATTRSSTTTSNSWFINSSGVNAGSGGNSSVRTGGLGALTSGPTGTSSSSTSLTILPYSNNSYERGISVTYGSSAGNLVGGIKSLQLLYGWGCYQIEFSPNIPKVSGQTLILNFKNSWARRPL